MVFGKTSGYRDRHLDFVGRASHDLDQVIEQFLPVLTMAVRLVAGGAFTVSAWHKWKDLEGTEAAILDYRLASALAARLVAPILATLEGMVGVALVLGMAAGALVAGALLTLFAVAVASALVRGLRIDCHCSEESEPIGAGLIGRDLVLAVLLIGTLGTSSRWFWPDHLVTGLSQALSTAFLLATVATVYSIHRIPAPIGAVRGHSP